MARARGCTTALAPISGDVVAFDLVDASGRMLRCSRNENAELFALALGGYGLFGPSPACACVSRRTAGSSGWWSWWISPTGSSATPNSFLAWARERWACVVVNLHTQHDVASLAKTERDFQRLIDRAIAHGGSYFLTYHRFARTDQVATCHPRFREFLAQKRRFDPDERFSSDWYVHVRAPFG